VIIVFVGHRVRRERFVFAVAVVVGVTAPFAVSWKR
jgi:hypothetical protein